VTVSYSGQFSLTFGNSGQATTANCHTPAATYLEKDLNQTGSLVHLAKVGHILAAFYVSVCMYLKKVTVPRKMCSFIDMPTHTSHPSKPDSNFDLLT